MHLYEWNNGIYFQHSISKKKYVKKIGNAIITNLRRMKSFHKSRRMRFDVVIVGVLSHIIIDFVDTSDSDCRTDLSRRRRVIRVHGLLSFRGKNGRH